jgi:hypothetical protein
MERGNEVRFVERYEPVEVRLTHKKSQEISKV